MARIYQNTSKRGTGGSIFWIDSGFRTPSEDRLLTPFFGCGFAALRVLCVRAPGSPLCPKFRKYSPMSPKFSHPLLGSPIMGSHATFASLLRSPPPPAGDHRGLQ